MTENQKRIVLTGGGTAGHVMPHFALLDDFRNSGCELAYIGSSGIEKSLVEGAGLRFYQIQAGKLRRYFSFKNFTDLFRIVIGFVQSLAILLKLRPSVVFSKGGFVTVPVVFAAWVLRIPIVSHESDLTPGLANRLAGPFAKKIFYTFEETKKFLSREKAVYTGTPIRGRLKAGSKEKGLAHCGFTPDDSRPVVLVMGGSLGAKNLNERLLAEMPSLAVSFRFIHITGKGKSTSYQNPGSYHSFEYVGEQLPDLFAATDLVVARAGANSIFEFLALNLPMLLVPLEQGSRGDQIVNARSFEQKGWAHVAKESDLAKNGLLEYLRRLSQEADKIKESQLKSGKVGFSTGQFVEKILSCMKQ